MVKSYCGCHRWVWPPKSQLPWKYPFHPYTKNNSNLMNNHIFQAYKGFILWGARKITVFQNPSCFFPSLSVFLITCLLDTDMEKTLLSMLGEIIDFCSVRATIKTEDHSTLWKCAVYRITSASQHTAWFIYFWFFNDLCFLMHLPVTILSVVGMFE